MKQKKVIILGFGREGKDTLNFLRKAFPDKILGIADRSILKVKDEKVKRHFGRNYLRALKEYDVIIKSPGIPFKALPKNIPGKISSQTDVFFENCPGKIVGVTGTKGKSTTAALIYQILKKGGVRTHLVGNIGKPVLSLLSSAKKDDVYVYELSSHQLYNLKKSPQVSVLLNIHPEHLDYYRSFREYIDAKANITRYQTKSDYLVFNSRNKIVKQIAEKSRARRIPVSGEYYALDRAAARAVGKLFKIPPRVIDGAIQKFKPLPHRLELVGRFRGIDFYNDALATIPEATILALDRLGDKVETILLGGYERNIDYKNLAKRIFKSRIKTLILFPTTGKRIWQEIKRQGEASRFKAFFANNMRQAVRLAYQNTSRGKICLLSTASASFSIFKNYEEKGNLFKQFVKSYGREKKS